MTSPRSMIIFRPSTAVKPFSPSMMKRRANAMCLWAGAVSLGSISWRPPYMVSVVCGASG